jgi:acyl carrier protein
VADERDKPGTALEAELNGAFRRVLGAEHIEPADNFFALGGNSLLALDLIEHVRRDYRVKIPLRDFFSVPTIEGLASLVAAAGPHDAAEPRDAAIGEHASD